MLFETLLLISALSAPSDDASNLHVDRCDFGEVYAFGTANCEFAIENVGESPIRLTQFSGVSESDTVQFHETTVAGHSTSYVRAQIHPGNALGHIRHKFTLRAGSADIQVSAFGFVISAFEPAPLDINLGAVDLKGVAVTKSLQLQSAVSPHFKMLKIAGKPVWLDAAISEDRQGITASVPKSSPVWGAVADFVKIETDNPVQKDVWISVEADIQGDIVPSFNPLTMGLMHPEDKNEFRVPLQSKSGKPFRIGKIRLANVDGQVTSSPCVPDVKGCQWLSLTISASQPKGTIKGDVFVELPDEHKQLKIGLRGLLLDKTATIKTLDPNREDLGLAETPQFSSYARTHQDLGSALKKAVDHSSDSPPSGEGPLLKWTISNAQNVHGFQIFRSESETGPFLLLNIQSIPNDKEDEDSGTFQWRDQTAQHQKTYWYEIGLVLNDGRKQMLTDPVKVVAK